MIFVETQNLPTPNAVFSSTPAPLRLVRVDACATVTDAQTLRIDSDWTRLPPADVYDITNVAVHLINGEYYGNFVGEPTYTIISGTRYVSLPTSDLSDKVGEQVFVTFSSIPEKEQFAWQVLYGNYTVAETRTAEILYAENGEAWLDITDTLWSKRNEGLPLSSITPRFRGARIVATECSEQRLTLSGEVPDWGYDSGFISEWFEAGFENIVSYSNAAPFSIVQGAATEQTAYNDWRGDVNKAVVIEQTVSAIPTIGQPIFKGVKNPLYFVVPNTDTAVSMTLRYYNNAGLISSTTLDFPTAETGSIAGTWDEPPIGATRGEVLVSPVDGYTMSFDVENPCVADGVMLVWRDTGIYGQTPSGVWRWWVFDRLQQYGFDVAHENEVQRYPLPANNLLQPTIAQADRWLQVQAINLTLELAKALETLYTSNEVYLMANPTATTANTRVKVRPISTPTWNDGRMKSDLFQLNFTIDLGSSINR